MNFSLDDIIGLYKINGRNFDFYIDLLKVEDKILVEKLL